jgi:hypothetical protein
MKLSLIKVLLVASLFVMPTVFSGCAQKGCPAQMSFDPASRASYKKKKPAKQLKKAKNKKSGIFDG